MKKSTKGEVVLSPCEIHATRLNRLEYRRLQRNITLLDANLQHHIAQLHRQAQGLRYHFTNAVRVVKTNRVYQSWRQAHAHEIAQDEAKDLIETIKLKEKSNLTIRRSPTPLSAKVPSNQALPLLLLLNTDNDEKVSNSVKDVNVNTCRPKTSINLKQSTNQHRANPLLTMLNGRPITSNAMHGKQEQNSIEFTSLQSFSSVETLSPRKLVQGTLVTTHKVSSLDALHRMARQNQTAYKAVEHILIEKRKLLDKEFAFQYRALRGTMQSVGIMN